MRKFTVTHIQYANDGTVTLLNTASGKGLNIGPLAKHQGIAAWWNSIPVSVAHAKHTVPVADIPTDGVRSLLY